MPADSWSRRRKLCDTRTDANGVILAQAGRFGGWSLYYMKDGKPVYTYSFLGLERFNIAASQPLLSGNATIRYEFAYDGGGLGKGGNGTLFVNGQKVATGHIERTLPFRLSLDETLDVGEDTGTPVVEDYVNKTPFTFTGVLKKVVIELGKNGLAASDDKKLKEAGKKLAAVRD